MTVAFIPGQAPPGTSQTPPQLNPCTSLESSSAGRNRAWGEPKLMQVLVLNRTCRTQGSPSLSLASTTHILLLLLPLHTLRLRLSRPYAAACAACFGMATGVGVPPMSSMRSSSTSTRTCLGPLRLPRLAAASHRQQQTTTVECTQLPCPKQHTGAEFHPQSTNTATTATCCCWRCRCPVCCSALWPPLPQVPAGCHATSGPQLLRFSSAVAIAIPQQQ
jgi:hypothetical protein